MTDVEYPSLPLLLFELVGSAENHPAYFGKSKAALFKLIVS